MRLIIAIILIIGFISCDNSKHDKAQSGTPTVISNNTVMTDSIKNDILEQINLSIKSGFYDKEEIFTNVEDYLYKIPFDQDWTKKQIDSLYASRVKEQSTWPAITDFD